MKDKGKQIEEMAKLLSTVKRCEALALSECIKKKCEYPHYEGVTCIAEHQAEKLYEQGYRKLPKDSVVLSKEEYEILQRLYDEIFMCHCILPDKAVENAKIFFADQKELIEKAYNQGSKETAEKIFCKLKERVKTRYTLLGNHTCYGDIEFEIDNLADEIGVEIKEKL